MFVLSSVLTKGNYFYESVSVFLDKRKIVSTLIAKSRADTIFSLRLDPHSEGQMKIEKLRPKLY